jgi:molecular chaperone GrpE
MSGKKKQNQTGENNTEKVVEIHRDIMDGDTAPSNNSTGSTDNNSFSNDGADGEKMIKGSELDAIKNELDDKSRKCEEYLDKCQRIAAEFDNFKRRSAKEKEALYQDAISDVVSSFLPVIDNIERALQAISSDCSAQSLQDGVEMVFKQFKDVMKNIGVEEIKALNETFDPMLHNAVMHVDDDSLGHSQVVEEFQKGYVYKDKVIRYSMVKVAN